jgi:phage terminase large subunit-like protein
MAASVMLTQLHGARLYALAADLDQGRLLIDSIAGFAARTPELGSALKIDSYRVVSTRTGCILDVLAADAPSAWGIRPAFTFVDEIAQWATTGAPRRLFEAVSSAHAKVKGSRLVVASTAGDPAHWSYKLLMFAKNDPTWRVNEVLGPAPWLDPRRLEEQRRRLPEPSYMRLFENVWTSPEDRLTSIDDLSACITLHDWPLEPEAGRRYVIGVDVGLKRDATVAAVCHAEREGDGTRVVLDRLEVWSGSRLRPVRLQVVEEWLAEASARYGRARVILDPWQSVGMMQRLRDRRITAEEFVFSAQSVGRLAATLHALIRDHRLALPEDEELLDELANVRLKETSPGVLRLDHDNDRHDDRAVALALASHYLIERGTPRPMTSHVARGRIPLRSTRRHGDLRELANQLGVPFHGGTR